MRKFEDVDYNQVAKKCVEDRSNAVDMMKKMDFFELLQQLGLDEKNKKLIPLVIMKAKKKEMQLKNLQKVEEEKKSKSGKIGIRGQDVSSEIEDQVSKYELAYKEMLKSTQNETNMLKVALNKFMLETISDLFEGSKPIEKSPILNKIELKEKTEQFEESKQLERGLSLQPASMAFMRGSQRSEVGDQSGKEKKFSRVSIMNSRQQQRSASQRNLVRGSQSRGRSSRFGGKRAFKKTPVVRTEGTQFH